MGILKPPNFGKYCFLKLMMTDNNQLTDIAETQETQMNTTFADQRVIQQALGQQTVLPPQAATMPDLQWTAAQQLQKPIFVTTQAWNMSSAAGDELTNISLPDYYSGSATNLHQQTLQMYTYFRGNPVFRLQLNGTKFHMGQIIMCWMPLRTHTFSSIAIASITGYPHVQISASCNDPVELKIPYVHPQDYLMTNSDNTCELGQLRVFVINPLQSAASSSPELNYTITLHWDQPEVHIPMFNHAVRGSLGMEETPVVAKGLFDTLSDLTGNATAAFSHLMTGNIRGVLKEGSEAMGTMSTLDKPNYIGVPQKTISPIGALSHGKGVDTSIRLGLDSGAHVPKIIETFGGTKDEMSIKHVASTPMMVQTVQWNSSRVSGDVLAHWAVSPVLCTATALAGPPFLCFLAQVYAYWRGSIKYRFDFISTSFHTGRLLICFKPNDQNSDVLSFENAMTLPNAIVDIQKSSRVTIEVPYTSATPYRCTAGDATEVYTGKVYVFVLNPLVHPSNVPPSIAFNLYISGGDDFEFAVPRTNLAEVVTDVPETEIVAKGLFEDVQEGGVGQEDSVIVLSTKTAHQYKNNFGEEFSLFDVAKRFGAIDVPDLNLATLILPITPYVVDGTAIQKLMPPVTYILQIFACWFGSLRYKIMTTANRSAENILTVHTVPNIGKDQSGYNLALGQPVIATNLAQDSCLEFEVCPYTFYNFALTNHPDKRRSRDDMGYWYTTLSNTTISPSGPLYISAGDDFQAFYMVAPPYMENFVQTHVILG